MNPQEAFGLVLASLRQQQGIDVDELARRAGMNAQNVAAFESGNDEPILEEIFRLAKALDVSPGRLIADMEGISE